VVKHVRGGLVIQHRKYIGEIRFTRTAGPLIAALKCQNRSREWQLLGAFVGRLAYHFKNEIAAMNIQFEPEV